VSFDLPVFHGHWTASRQLLPIGDALDFKGKTRMEGGVVEKWRVGNSPNSAHRTRRTLGAESFYNQ
jgi:hypothetical protein